MFDAAEPFSPSFESLSADRPPSAARLAAEAFFAPSHDPLPATQEPDVLVRKRRLDESQRSPVSEQDGASESVRTPRVFRLSASTLAIGAPASHGPSADAAAAAGAGRLEAGSTAVRAAAGKALRRNKRRELHGEVTITRPAGPTAPLTAVDSGLSAQSWLPTPLATAQPRLAGRVRAPLLELEWPRYLGMRRQLHALQLEARAAKARELPAALAWIKRAIADHDLTPHDLGFGN